MDDVTLKNCCTPGCEYGPGVHQGFLGLLCEWCFSLVKEQEKE